MRYSDWNYYNPVFESDLLNPAMIVYSPWSGHRRFIYDLTRFLEPDMIVELGSYYGCSAFTFLQAIKDGNLGTSFYAVDTWEGDSYTANDYREDIFGAYKETQDTCFSNQNSFMLRMTFDEASDQFAKQSISILHIDGSHSYEDVKHDFKPLSQLGFAGYMFNISQAFPRVNRRGRSAQEKSRGSSDPRLSHRFRKPSARPPRNTRCPRRSSPCSGTGSRHGSSSLRRRGWPSRRCRRCSWTNCPYRSCGTATGSSAPRRSPSR